MADSPWRVFVSHTSELRDFPRALSYVTAVERAISASGHTIVDTKDFPAADKPPAMVGQHAAYRRSRAGKPSA